MRMRGGDGRGRRERFLWLLIVVCIGVVRVVIVGPYPLLGVARHLALI